MKAKNIHLNFEFWLVIFLTAIFVFVVFNAVGIIARALYINDLETIYTSTMPDDLPAVEINLSGNQTHGTLYFEASNVFNSDGNYMMQVDTSTGEIIIAREFDAFGMKFERHNEHVMSFYEYTERVWNGQVKHEAYGGIRYHTGGVMRIMDNEYRVIRTIDDGINVDSHDLEIMPDGSWVYLAPDTRRLDRSDSTITCLLDCFLLGQSVVSVDANNERRVIWNALDYYEQSDFVMDDVFELDHNILYDVIHANSVNITPSGHLIISMRHTNEVMEITQFGTMVWRSRDMDIDSPFAHQHDAHILSNGNLLLFDNGNGLRDYSRVVEYAMNHDDNTLRLVWEYENGHYAPNRGSVQRLSNGNTLINFVDGGIVEVNEAGDVLMEIKQPQGYASYQARVQE